MALAVEIAENELRRAYTPREVRVLAEDGKGDPGNAGEGATENLSTAVVFRNSSVKLARALKRHCDVANDCPLNEMTDSQKWINDLAADLLKQVQAELDYGG